MAAGMRSMPDIHVYHSVHTLQVGAGAAGHAGKDSCSARGGAHPKAAVHSAAERRGATLALGCMTVTLYLI
jgi:hypothetical protein